MRKTKRILSLILVLSSLALAAVGHARSIANPQNQPKPLAVPQGAKHVDLVIALDTSGSMDGLINSAREKLWEVVNLLSKAEPRPDLRVALISYGGSGQKYSPERGYVNIESDLTTDLDAISSKLFALTTSGGDEYVARAVTVATRELSWAKDQGALKIIFVAGNEPANQDPKIPIEKALSDARSKNIFVNTIYCGSQTSGEAALWQQVAQLGSGRYASIDHNHVVAIATPMDAELGKLSSELNGTYIAYGAKGGAKAEEQKRQDANATSASPAAPAARAATKASKLYRADDWDLVDAAAQGRAVSEDEMPAPMKSMDAKERKAFVETKAKDRARIQTRIAELSKQREAYIATEKKNKKVGSQLDDAMSGAVRSQAKSAGFNF